MYAFQKVDAARSFKEAKLDPTCMCFWGKLGPGTLFKWKNARSGSAKSLYIHSGRSRISSRSIRYRKKVDLIAAMAPDIMKPMILKPKQYVIPPILKL